MTRWLIKIKKRHETNIKLKFDSRHADFEGFVVGFGISSDEKCSRLNRRDFLGHEIMNGVNDLRP